MQSSESYKNENTRIPKDIEEFQSFISIGVGMLRTLKELELDQAEMLPSSRKLVDVLNFFLAVPFTKAKEDLGRACEELEDPMQEVTRRACDTNALVTSSTASNSADKEAQLKSRYHSLCTLGQGYGQEMDRLSDLLNSFSDPNKGLLFPAGVKYEEVQHRPVPAEYPMELLLQTIFEKDRQDMRQNRFLNGHG